MWFIYALVSVLMQGLVNYIDEFLTNNNKVKDTSDIHTKTGGLIIISTVMSFMTSGLIYFFTRNVSLPTNSLVLAIGSAVPMVAMYISYFYLLISYPVHQVGPLFQISSLWLLFIEILFGGSVSYAGLAGILFLTYGAYLLDAGTFKWQTPTKLLLMAIPATSTWAISLYMARVASYNGVSPISITFWQMFGIGIIGIFLFSFVTKYREGFLHRIRNQGKVFLGLSLINESLAEGSFLFGNMAVAIAPVAAFVSSMSGVQSVFILLLFYLFPQGKRSKATPIQWFAIFLIAIGVSIIELRH